VCRHNWGLIHQGWIQRGCQCGSQSAHKVDRGVQNGRSGAESTSAVGVEFTGRGCRLGGPGYEQSLVQDTRVELLDSGYRCRKGSAHEPRPRPLGGLAATDWKFGQVINLGHGELRATTVARGNSMPVSPYMN
jgi:hypothetical protein